ncbi:MAG TPA: pyridoxamine 5'-phosphate oxidase [Solirubrobacterales bacterium]|jgi:pyridoxamine 5'-phosphate oxidase|nr:pyridoxamine 5'-phosphate oxidase [Solirubrobacterales bacterium]
MALMTEPFESLDRWLDQAREAQVPAPGAMTLATATPDGVPSARVVTLKQLDGDGLVFTTALWTRKAEELRLNPRVVAVFYWPTLGRQARIEGRAEMADRELAEKLFASRPRDHRLQALVSRQGEAIEDLARLRERLERVQTETADQPLECPPDWGAVRIVPDRIEFWEEAPDRLHDRRLYEAVGDGWRQSRLAP